MCVIAICQKKRIPKKEFAACAEANSDGFGIAWYHGSMVKYKKSMNEREIELLTQQVPLPYVVHFRLASVGGKKVELCHPFPISHSAPADKEGIVKRVLFHNGHISNWQDVLKKSASNLKVTPPNHGPMSDTRAMAWIADKAGLKYIDKLPGRYVIMSHDVFSYHGSWDTKDEILYSNLFWTYRMNTSGYSNYNFKPRRKFRFTQEPTESQDTMYHQGDRWRFVNGAWLWIDEPPPGRSPEEIKEIKDCQENAKQFMSECGLVLLPGCHASFHGDYHTETEHRIMCTPIVEEFKYSGNAMMCSPKMQGIQHSQADHDAWCKDDYLDRSAW